MNSTPPWSRMRWHHPERRTACPASARLRAPHVCERYRCMTVRFLQRRKRSGSLAENAGGGKGLYPLPRSMPLYKPGPPSIMSDLHLIQATTSDGVPRTAFRSRRFRQLFPWRSARRRRIAVEALDACADPEAREPDSLAGYGIRRSAALARRKPRSDGTSYPRTTPQRRRIRRVDHSHVEALPRLELVPR